MMEAALTWFPLSSIEPVWTTASTFVRFNSVLTYICIPVQRGWFILRDVQTNKYYVKARCRLIASFREGVQSWEITACRCQVDMTEVLCSLWPFYCGYHLFLQERHRNIYIPTNVTSLNRNLGKEGTIVFHYFEHDALNVCFCLQIDVMFPI